MGNESANAKEVLSKLGSKFPEVGTASAEVDKCNKLDLENYLFLPVAVVADRLRKGTHDNSITKHLDVLRDIDSSFEESLPDDWLLVREALSEPTISVLNTENVQAQKSLQIGDQVFSDVTTKISEDNS